MRWLLLLAAACGSDGKAPDDTGTAGDDAAGGPAAGRWEGGCEGDVDYPYPWSTTGYGEHLVLDGVLELEGGGADLTGAFDFDESLAYTGTTSTTETGSFAWSLSGEQHGAAVLLEATGYVSSTTTYTYPTTTYASPPTFELSVDGDRMTGELVFSVWYGYRSATSGTFELSFPCAFDRG